MFSSRFRSGLRLLAVAPLFLQFSLAAPVRELDPKALVSGADLIVIGRVVSITEEAKESVNVQGNLIPSTRCTGTLQIDGVIKGEAHIGALSLTFYSPAVPSAVRSIPLGQYGMYFLRQSDTGLTIYDPVYPYLPAVPGAYNQATALDRVTAVLAKILNSRSEPNSRRLEALQLLGKLKTDAAKQSLVDTLNIETGEFRLHVAATLVASNEVTGLPPLVDALLHRNAMPNSLVRYLARSLGGMRDPRAVPILAPLLSANDSEIRMGVAMALRQSGTSAALEPLSNFLYDSNTLINYYAVVGLGEITRQDEWTPSFETFEHNPAPFLAYWREWAATNFPRHLPS